MTTPTNRDDIPCPNGCADPLEGQYLHDESEDEGRYDGYLCCECHGYWSTVDLERVQAMAVRKSGPTV